MTSTTALAFRPMACSPPNSDFRAVTTVIDDTALRTPPRRKAGLDLSNTPTCQESARGGVRNPCAAPWQERALSQFGRFSPRRIKGARTTRNGAAAVIIETLLARRASDAFLPIGPLTKASGLAAFHTEGRASRATFGAHSCSGRGVFRTWYRYKTSGAGTPEPPKIVLNPGRPNHRSGTRRHHESKLDAAGLERLAPRTGIKRMNLLGRLNSSVWQTSNSGGDYPTLQDRWPWRCLSCRRLEKGPARNGARVRKRQPLPRRHDVHSRAVGGRPVVELQVGGARTIRGICVVERFVGASRPFSDQIGAKPHAVIR